MKLPYNHLNLCDSVLFAARGGTITSFRVSDGTHLSAWTHPDVLSLDSLSRSDAGAGADANANADADADTDIARIPPPKRRRMSDEHQHRNGALKHGTSDGSEDPRADEATEEDAAGFSKEGPAKSDLEAAKSSSSNKSDIPTITILVATSDYRHLLAVSGHDKTVWVFEHDGDGQLSQLSRRMMPKRPSAVLVSRDDGTILSADKFGDVYSLPLLPEPSVDTDGANISAPSLPSRKPKPATRWPAGTTLTVHSKRNLEALNNQLRQAKRTSDKTAAAGADTTEPDARGEPPFQLTVQLGHVSMLTGLMLAQHGARRYVLTADRDEHLRVSRYLPQAHVIEAFCLGHSEFISALAIPVDQPEMLISAGGDPDLYVWDWRVGILKSTVNILSLVRQVSASTTQIAVSQLHATILEGQGPKISIILAICEDVPAVFWWQVTEKHILQHPEITALPGNPLHMTSSRADQPESFILVALHEPADDRTQPPPVVRLHLDHGHLAVQPTFCLQDIEPHPGCTPNLPGAEVRRLFYTTATLRKVRNADTDADPYDEDDIPPSECM